MHTLPDLSQLSHEQKDELIGLLFGQVQELMAQVQTLTAQVQAQQKRIEELQGRLGLNSTNSSRPPSSDGLNKPAPKSLRKPAQRPSGGQKGHSGNTLRQTAQPDEIVTHQAPHRCPACHATLECASLAEVRQVFDLPTLRFKVTEHRLMQARCRCGQVHRGQFPAHVSAAVQYGPQVLAAMVHLNQHHMVPVARTAQLMRDLFGLQVSEAIVLKACAQAKERLQPTVDAIARALQHAPIVHADETGLRADKRLYWMHVQATPTLTWVGCHPKRGSQAFEEFQSLPAFKGTLIHDGWAPYRALECTHGLCNAHHLRELTYVHEQQNQAWALDMIELLTQAQQRTAQSGTPLPAVQLGHLRYVYDEILSQAECENPRASATGKRGRVKQSKAANLIARLRQYADDVWRFATDAGVPFTNNIAEQAVRMPKVKQKISGGFRTLEGAKIFCVIRSYLATMHKQGANLLEALTEVFRGTVPQPRGVGGGPE